MDENYLHDNDVAPLLGITIKALRNKVASGDPLPPYAMLPGMRVRLWPVKEVEQWILQFMTNNVPVLAVTSIQAPVLRRGRPPKVSRRKQR